MPEPTQTQVQPASSAIPSFGDLFRCAFDLFKKHWQGLVVLQLIAGVVSAIVSFFNSRDVKIDDSTFSFSYTSIGITVLVAWIVTGAISIIVQGALVHYLEKNGQGGVQEALVAAARKLLSLWWAGLLTTILTFIGVFLFILPGIYIGVALSFVVFVIMLEGKRGTEALRASHAYVKGRWWTVFGRFVVFGIVSIAVYLAAILVSGFGHSSTTTSLVSSLIGLVWTPIGIAFMYEMYKSLRETKATQ